MIWKPFGLGEISLYVPQTVYPPREDTNLLDRALAGLGKGAGRRLLEIGCGCGAISIAAARRGWEVSACDIHPLAIASTIGNASENDCYDLIDVGESGPGDDGDWKPPNGADVIAWNLPYLDPGDENDEEKLGPLEDAGLIDSSCGRRLLTELESDPNLLRDGGVILLLHSSNAVGKALASMWRKAGWATRIQYEAIVGDEKLSVIAVWRPFQKTEPILLDECKSTNLEILDSDVNIGQLIMALEQTEGRGQHGRKWDGGKGGFLGSWNVFPDSIERIPGFHQLATSVAIFDSFSALKSLPLTSHSWSHASTINEVGIIAKWPNDIYLKIEDGFAKIGGILAESRSKGGVTKLAIGVGLNRFAPDSNIEAAGWDDVPGLKELSMKDLFPILNASMSSMFESHPLLVDIDKQSILQSHYALMLDSYYNGNVAGKDVIGLNEKGHLLARDVIIDSTVDLNWNWN
ncbi:MAG: 50S ribosomal protein L11 methyltransferase [Candidatus Thermoplasmatota archaeon]|nr:50S ribosomal protein L11 methyltransferase [Candidatus Thermoplasmatota archaeon]